ncbi:hypothetical protein BDQ12DRAFT_638024 [Crucibulum laeve]|uniref:Cytochrome c oxidase assembly protein COX20, mitochondrial n=1 Tax=Crucibulum laeve TaxID=68775 RepID=A0A5C3LKD3_9AGAR|nr:hypothetical protein BDQ12DRAFT_638024 [Crucibulum laeve]
MSSESSSSRQPPASSTPSSIPSLPTRGPQPTGHILHDSLESAKHITEVPCARNSLLAGIASGLGIGVIRGLSAGPLMAGNWAVATFTVISIGSWHICQNQFANERKKVATVIEAMPRRTAKQAEEKPSAESSLAS